MYKRQLLHCIVGVLLLLGLLATDILGFFGVFGFFGVLVQLGRLIDTVRRSRKEAG